jgi:hypothetical protein
MQKCVTNSIPMDVNVGSLSAEFLTFCREIQRALETPNGIAQQLPRLRERACSYQTRPTIDELRLMLASNIVLDLALHGSSVNVNRRSANLVLSSGTEVCRDRQKEEVRQRHLVERDAQLREPAVQEFVRGMERRKLRNGVGWHSIHSVMRDGEELAASLRRVSSYTDLDDRTRELAGVIDPYLQFVTPDAICSETGLKLQDVWRYFRHTWTNAYRSVPGRSIMVLVRDRARPYHPVIGLAALANSVVQQAIRDRWIGWNPEFAVRELISSPNPTHIKRLLAYLDVLIKSVYVTDLIQDDLLKRANLNKPTDDVIKSLRLESLRTIKLHRQNPDVIAHKTAGHRTAKELFVLAKTNLFRSKRCRQLAALLEIRQTLQKKQFERLPKKQLPIVMQEQNVIKALRRLIRFGKAERVGISMMDITVCGAVAPYNAVLGGKLVCHLLCSPEVVKEYARRYRDYASIIASGMKGSRVNRKPQLVLLCTTSLYGNGSSQYNRIKIPAEAVGGESGELLRYEELGTSAGFGSFHFSKETIRITDALLGRSNNGRKVNSIFGEGVNPLMRKMREALALIGLPTDLLKHGNKRIVYGIPLARNFRAFLLGEEKRIQYIIPQTKAKLRTSQLASYWAKRWLARRIEDPAVLERVSAHSLAYPIRHGAQVQLPCDEVPELLRSLAMSGQF